MTYRFATAVDISLLAALNEQLIEDEHADTALRGSELESRMQGWLNADSRAIVFEVDAAPIGYALFRPDEQGVYLRQFFIDRLVRRKGLGRAAVGILLRDVFPRGCRVTLEVLAQNEEGLAFWRALGFVDHAQTLRTYA